MTIQSEADRLLSETGLLSALSRHGKPFITGSYAMNMMAWNDLDLYLQPNPDFDPYAMIADVNAALRPFRLDGFCGDQGTFYGCETRATGERWNVDIWVRTEAEIAQSLEYCAELVRKVDAQPGARKAILEIKHGLSRAKLYGFDKHPSRHYHSRDVYGAVLNDDVRSLNEFLQKHPL